MTCPTDAAIARAFWTALSRQVELGVHAENDFHRFLRNVQAYARKFDSEAGGTDRQTEEVMQIGPDAEGGNVPVASAADGKAAAPLVSIPVEATSVVSTDDTDAGNNGVHTIPEKVTTSPERVQIPSESEHAAPYDRCPKCTAHMPVGQTCGGVSCGLKPG